MARLPRTSLRPLLHSHVPRLLGPILRVLLHRLVRPRYPAHLRKRQHQPPADLKRCRCRRPYRSCLLGRQVSRSVKYYRPFCFRDRSDVLLLGGGIFSRRTDRVRPYLRAFCSGDPRVVPGDAE